jgi:ribosomal-protein-alanine N-acetyltransferase
MGHDEPDLRVAALRLRRLTPGDHDFVRELSRDAFAEFARDPVATTLAMALRFEAFIAERDHSPIGFAVLRLGQGGSAELAAIAVLEHERGRGVGRSLLRAVEIAARGAGASSLSLHTAEANLAAFELFYKQGYRLERRLPRYYVGVYDACELRKRL